MAFEPFTGFKDHVPLRLLLTVGVNVSKRGCRKLRDVFGFRAIANNKQMARASCGSEAIISGQCPFGECHTYFKINLPRGDKHAT